MYNKKHKSFASHYILLPNGKVGKWPIVTVDEAGVILQVELRDSFKERSGLEMHPGILLPAFIDLCETNFENEEATPNFNRHFAHGTILLGSEYRHQDKSLPRLTDSEKNDADGPSFLTRDGKSDTSLLHRMQEYHQCSPDQMLSKMLFWATRWGADKTEFGEQLGQLKEGFKPGVLVLQKIDLHAMILTPEAQVKWLSVPMID